MLFLSASCQATSIVHRHHLKEELEARGEPKTGAEAWLRRRLHAAIVRAHLESGDAGDGL